MTEPLQLNFRFAVSFLSWGKSVDLRFQRVSGLGATVTSASVAEGGQNLYTQSLPERVSFGALVLERGRVVTSLLNFHFDEAMSQFRFRTTDVLVTLLGEDRAPISAWMFHGAYPSKWTTGDLSAATPAILIDTMELTYRRMRPMVV